ncbi:MAG: hypothetical protein FWC11_04060 [Firmicutes bacterium]|nr:hypothetical protein [Bacillota bacterium]MCL2256016.1 hypothetical protein [Bacillota bacterium]
MSKEKETKKIAKEKAKQEKIAKKEEKKVEKKSEPPVWVQCPRCDLNYIDKKDKLCFVCKAETGLVDKSVLIPDEDDVIEKICPICVTSFVAEKPNEEICYSCKKEQDSLTEKDFFEEEEEVDEDVKKVKDIDLGIDETAIEEVDSQMFEGELEEEEEEEEEEDFSSQYAEPDDFDFEINEDDFLDRPEDEDDEDSEDDDEEWED